MSESLSVGQWAREVPSWGRAASLAAGGDVPAGALALAADEDWQALASGWQSLASCEPAEPWQLAAAPWGWGAVMLAVAALVCPWARDLRTAGAWRAEGWQVDQGAAGVLMPAGAGRRLVRLFDAAEVSPAAGRFAAPGWRDRCRDGAAEVPVSWGAAPEPAAFDRLCERVAEDMASNGLGGWHGGLWGCARAIARGESDARAIVAAVKAGVADGFFTACRGCAECGGAGVDLAPATICVRPTDRARDLVSVRR
jgi:hypothetical protein